MIVLYAHPHSSNSRKVHWALEELGVPYEYRSVDLMKGEQKGEAYRRINPLGRVPAIQDGDVTMFESNAILTYLAERHGQGRLLPADPVLRAEVHEWLWWQASDLGGATLEPWLMKFFASLGAAPLDEAKYNAVVAAAAAPLDALEAQLKDREFVAAKTFSVADIAIAESVGLCEGAGIDMSARPSTLRWYARLSARDAFKKTRPQG